MPAGGAWATREAMRTRWPELRVLNHKTASITKNVKLPLSCGVWGPIRLHVYPKSAKTARSTQFCGKIASKGGCYPARPGVGSCFAKLTLTNRAGKPAPEQEWQTITEDGRPYTKRGWSGPGRCAFNFNKTELNFLGTLVGERMTKKGYILKFVSKGATEGSCIW